MTRVTLKVARIGNSRGVRLPAQTLKRFGIGDSVVMEERADGILLRPIAGGPVKLSWVQTATEMAMSDEDWSEWESLSDGLDKIPWAESAPAKHVAEPKSAYTVKKRANKRPSK